MIDLSRNGIIEVNRGDSFELPLIYKSRNWHPCNLLGHIEPKIDNRTRNQKISALIREKYSIDEELAIQRQRDTKPDEFQEYFEYCEFCKKQIKEGLWTICIYI